MIHHLQSMTARSIYLKAIILILLQNLHLNPCSYGFEANTDQPEESKSGNCNIFKYVGVNDLSVNDIVVKSSTSSLACIKARFSLAIKVETAPEDKLISESEHHLENGEREHTENDATHNDDSDMRLLLGYLPLDTVISVEDSCPDGNLDSVTKDGHQTEKGGRLFLNEPRELEMIVVFECGKLAFNFKRQENYYVSAIRGVVNLDSNTIREFIAEEPMFFTSDLSHHFKFNELIEVNSTAKTKAFILTANFYNLEFETFRNTSSRGFIRPPDDKSRPFPRRTNLENVFTIN